MSDYPGPRTQYVRGGTHLTASSFLPEALVKELTATEDAFYGWVGLKNH